MKHSPTICVLVATLGVTLVTRLSAQTFKDLNIGTNGSLAAISGNYVVGTEEFANFKIGFLYNISTGDYTGVAGPLTGISGNSVVGNFDDVSGFLYNISTGSYTILNGDPLTESGNSPAWAVSGDNILGDYLGGGDFFTYIYNINTGDYTTVNDTLGAAPSSQIGISGNYVVGDYLGTNCNAEDNGFLYNISTGDYTTLDDPLGVYGSWVWGISGNFVVGSYRDNGDQLNGFLYNISTGEYTTLDDPLGVNGTVAYASSGNYVAGYYWDANDYNHGFLYNISTGEYTTLDDPLGVNGTWLMGISGNNVVGYYYDSNDEQHAFLAELSPVTTLVATNVGNLSATLNGRLSTNRTTSAVYFQYGTNCTYGVTTPSENLGSDTNFSATISGLAPNTIYHYQAVAIVGGATNYGNDQTVTTEPCLLALANLSQDAYSPSPTGYTEPPDYEFLGGYSTFVTSPPPDGYSVNAYTSDDNSQIVIAFRGTFPHPTYELLYNLIADYGFPDGSPTAQLDLYTSAAAQFVQSVQQQYPKANITLTGHSLGAALAQLVGNASGLTTTVFNAPGSAALYPDLQLFLYYNWPAQPAQNPNVNYRIDGDQVSLAGTQFPSVITIASPYSLPALSGSPWLYLMSNASTILTNHSIDTVVAQIAANAPQTSGIPSSDPNLVPFIEQSVVPKVNSVLNFYQTIYNFTFSGNTSGVLLDAQQTGGGADFVFTENPGSPGITAVDVPSMSGVSSYEIRSETGTVWSTFQSVEPGNECSFDPVNGVEIVPLDENGNPVTETNLIFALYFSSTGSVSGSLVQSATPVALQISCVASQVNVSWNTNFAAGFTLMATTNLAPPIAWTAVTNIPVLVSNQMVVTLPIANQSQYFQLLQ